MGNTVVGNERGIAAKLVLFLMIVGALYYGYYRFQATPRYALMQFKKAVVFSDGETAAKYLDMESFIQDLPEKLTANVKLEDMQKRIINEIDSPHEKSLFATVKNWTTLKIPITIDGDVARVEQEDGTAISLEKVSERQWRITSIRFAKGEGQN